jgi:prepilin-type processing-associated H-X9-DG protein
MSIRFTCPHCGAASDVADQYAGQCGPCAQCGKTIAIPSMPGMTGAPAKRGMSGGMIALIVVAAAVPVLLVVVGILLALLLPAITSAREAARRASCFNHLKQISLAVQCYESAYGHFPPAYVADENGKPLYSWRVLILPYMEHQDLYQQFNLKEPWNSPGNRKISDVVIQEFQCPSSQGANPTETNYVMVVGPGAISDGPTGCKPSEIIDGTSNTILAVEVAGSGINWAEPRDLSLDDIRAGVNPPGGKGLRSGHPGGVNVAFCDGSVQLLPNSISPDTLRRLVLRNDGEPLNRSEFDGSRR